MMARRPQAATATATDDELEINAITVAVSRTFTVANTKKVYDRIAKEWLAFCLYVSGPANATNMQFPAHMTSGKVSKFMFYQCFRKKQQTGGVAGGGLVSFDPEEYEDVKKSYNDAFSAWQLDQTRNPMPDPEGGGIGYSSIMQYRAGLKKVYEGQVQGKTNSDAWDLIWTLTAKQLVKIVEGRKARIGREKHDEKVTKEFAGYHAVDRFDDIEEEFWNRGLEKNMRKAFPYIRHRMVLLYTTSGILRCESLTKAELSDFQGLTVKKETDIDPLYLMILQIPEGEFSCRKYLGIYLGTSVLTKF